jgi:imidazolonepropionase-like amidohydrolase
MADATTPWFAITGATIYPSPDAPPIPHGTVLCRAGRIDSVGRDLSVPPDATVLPADGRFVTAGFWNCHVHFTEPRWKGADRAPASKLEDGLREMCTQRGFTSVVDLGSDPRSTFPLRRRVDAGEVLGPAIRTVGIGLYPPRGLPYYVRREVPVWIRWILPQPRSPASATRAVERNFEHGADHVKLFTGSYIRRGVVKAMPERVARAAVDAAHRRGRLVFAHPSNLEGTRVAFRTGVDVLAHPPDSADGVDPPFVRSLVERGMSLIPTLKMFASTVSRSSSYLDPVRRIVREFREFGGELLFGTDVGYMRDYSTDEEFQELRTSGLDGRAILAMLTTAPARRFGVSAEQGSVTPGNAADLTVLQDDPIADPVALSRVRATVRAGRVLFATN